MRISEIIVEALDKPAPSIEELVTKHNTTEEHLLSQLKKGVKIEREHTDDLRDAIHIAMNHLDEDPDYYTKLAKAKL